MARRPISRSFSKKAPAATPGLRLFRLPGLPEIRRGDDLAAHILSAAGKARLHFENGDILVIRQKIVSKTEGAPFQLPTISPCPKPQTIAHRQSKDPGFVQV